jgi:hypothetical protein
MERKGEKALVSLERSTLAKDRDKAILWKFRE